jgi:hypothetical protein
LLLAAREIGTVSAAGAIDSSSSPGGETSKHSRGTLANRSLTSALVVVTAVAIIARNGGRRCRTVVGASNRLLH